MLDLFFCCDSAVVDNAGTASFLREISITALAFHHLWGRKHATFIAIRNVTKATYPL